MLASQHRGGYGAARPEPLQGRSFRFAFTRRRARANLERVAGAAPCFLRGNRVRLGNRRGQRPRETAQRGPSAQVTLCGDMQDAPQCPGRVTTIARTRGTPGRRGAASSSQWEARFLSPGSPRGLPSISLGSPQRLPRGLRSWKMPTAVRALGARTGAPIPAAAPGAVFPALQLPQTPPQQLPP